MQKVLVIGPESKQRKEILRLLLSEGYETIAAETSDAGLDLAHRHRPDLTLFLTAAQQGCCEFLEALQQRAELAVIPLIVAAEHTDQGDLRRFIQLGADDVLVHPFTDADLSAAIRTRLLKQARLTEQYVAVLRTTAERLNRLAHYDSLTDLPNHHLLHQRLVQAMERATQTQSRVALLSLSLDRLRQINNTLGYEAGDSLLQVAARRLRASLPEGTTVARLTGNQFAILLTHCPDSPSVRQVAEDLMNRLSQPFSLPQQEVFVTTSIGIAVYPDDSADIATLLRQTDAALECAKQQKSNYCQFFRTDMPVVSGDQVKLETWLRYALERHEFEIHYQPQLSLQHQTATGAEALIRWTHPEHGPISPGQFIPLAEETGLIVPIGEWILRRTCEQVSQWRQQGISGFHISVNLSSVQLNQSHLSQLIQQVLTETGLPADALELEITETTLMQDAATALKLLSELKGLGLKVAIDDFGTGYSSLSYLKQFPIDILKIDQCFVRGMTADPKNCAILTAVIQMAHDLNLSVTAEGVETPDELALLKSLGCDTVQGFLIGRPMPASAFADWLNQPMP